MITKFTKKIPTSPWLIALSCAGVALLFRVFIMTRIDLEPLYGPGGVKSLTALIENYPQRDWGTWVMYWFLPLVENQADLAAKISILLGATLTVTGVSLSASRIGGRDAGIIAGLFTSFYAPLVWTSLLIGADAIATGIAWFGIGIAWWSTSKRWWKSIPFCVFAAFCCIFAAKIKITALPSAAFLGLVPLLAFKQKWTGKIEGIVVGLFCAGALFYIKDSWMQSNDAHVGSTPDLSKALLLQGWNELQRIFNQYSVIVQLSYLALVGGILLGKNFLSRATLTILCGLVLCFTAATISDKVRPRYFIPASLPVFILCATALTQYKKLWPIKLIAGSAITVFLCLDSLAFHSSWATIMTKYSGGEAHQLPAVPDGWSGRYTSLSRLVHDDNSTVGAKRLHQLASEASSTIVYGVPLRDGREYHLTAAAGITNHKYNILLPRYCCNEDEELRLCAARTIQQLKNSSSRLILPIVSRNAARIPNQTATWTRFLLFAAMEDSSWVKEQQWGYLDGSGNAPPPCPKPTRQSKSIWDIDGENPQQRRNPRNSPKLPGRNPKVQ